MNVRRLLWRILLWVGVAAFLVSTLFTAIVNDDPTGILGFVMFPVVGAIILSSRPGNGVGWLLYGIGLAWTVSGPMSSGELSPDASWAELVLISVLSWFGWGSIPLIGVVFPTGRIETRLGRIAAAVLVGYLTVATVASITSPQRPGSVVDNPLAVPALEAPNGVILGPVGILVFLGAIIAIVVDLAIRWRRASGVQTLQYRWLVFSLAVVVVIVGTSGLLNLLYADAPWVPVVATCLSLSTNLIPIS